MDSAAHQNLPAGKWHIGTRFVIASSAVPKAGNGTFEITTLYPEQHRPDGQEYTFRRVNKAGQVTISQSTVNLRGGSERFLNEHATIISE